jgi:hypothetical protein
VRCTEQGSGRFAVDGGIRANRVIRDRGNRGCLVDAPNCSTLTHLVPWRLIRHDLSRQPARADRVGQGRLREAIGLDSSHDRDLACLGHGFCYSTLATCLREPAASSALLHGSHPQHDFFPARIPACSYWAILFERGRVILVETGQSHSGPTNLQVPKDGTCRTHSKKTDQESGLGKLIAVDMVLLLPVLALALLMPAVQSVRRSAMRKSLGTYRLSQQHPHVGTLSSAE